METLTTVLFASETLASIARLEEFIGAVWAEENAHEEVCGCDATHARYVALLDRARDELFRLRTDAADLLESLDEDNQEVARFLASVIREAPNN